MPASTRILLLAHGSSDRRWCETFEALARPTLDALPEARIAYMELSEPSLESQVEQAAAEGIKDIRVVPLFLAAGRHLRRDVPAMLEALKARLDIDVILLPPIGENPRLAHALKGIVTETLET